MLRWCQELVFCPLDTQRHATTARQHTHVYCYLRVRRDKLKSIPNLLAVDGDPVGGDNVAALGPGLPERPHDRPIRGQVEVAEDTTGMLAGHLDGMVEGHLREHVVDHVAVVNMVQPPVESRAEVTVNSSKGSTDEGPLLGVVVGKADVAVLEVGDEDEPEVDPEVWDEVPAKNIGETELVDSNADSEGSNTASEIRDGNVAGISGAEKGEIGRAHV